jgi:4-carboxymuconolactone decarboxylase
MEAVMAASTEFDKVLQEMADGGGPLLEALAKMNTGLIDGQEIDERTVLLMRFAALVALDAPAPSYLVTLALAEQSGITPQAVQAALVALAPVVGGPRVISAAMKVMQARQLAGG